MASISGSSFDQRGHFKWRPQGLIIWQRIFLIRIDFNALIMVVCEIIKIINEKTVKISFTILPDWTSELSVLLVVSSVDIFSVSSDRID